MKRREFFGKTVLGAGVAFAGAKAAAVEQNGANFTKSNFDVIVAGGGTAGVIAAIQSAALGAKTLLIESGGALGGTLTVAGVHHPGIFHAWGRQVIAGIGWALVKECADAENVALPDFSEAPKAHWKHQVWVNPYLYSCLAEEKALKSGVKILYYACPQSVEKRDGLWLVKVAGKNEAFEFHAPQLIDATGNAALCALAGFERQSDAEAQPGTQIYRLAGYDVKELDASALKIAVDAAKKSGELKPQDLLGSAPHFLLQGGFNQQHVLNASNATSSLQTLANEEGRASIMRVLRFLKRQKGLENAKIEYMAYETGIRETYRIKALHDVTLEEYTSAAVYPDGVCNAFYPVDLHTAHGVKPEKLKEGLVPGLPLSAMRPKGSDDILAAGRCVGSDRLANSALRVQAVCMAMGQAAGAAAALCAKSASPLSKCDIANLRKTLEGFGAIVPPAA